MDGRPKMFCEGDGAGKRKKNERSRGFHNVGLYALAEIVAYCRRHGGDLYLVRWVDYPRPGSFTWEPRFHLAPEENSRTRWKMLKAKRIFGSLSLDEAKRKALHSILASSQRALQEAAQRPQPEGRSLALENSALSTSDKGRGRRMSPFQSGAKALVDVQQKVDAFADLRQFSLLSPEDYRAAVTLVAEMEPEQTRKRKETRQRKMTPPASPEMKASCDSVSDTVATAAQTSGDVLRAAEHLKKQEVESVTPSDGVQSKRHRDSSGLPGCFETTDGNCGDYGDKEASGVLEVQKEEKKKVEDQPEGQSLAKRRREQHTEEERKDTAACSWGTGAARPESPKGGAAVDAGSRPSGSPEPWSSRLRSRGSANIQRPNGNDETLSCPGRAKVVAALSPPLSGHSVSRDQGPAHDSSNVTLNDEQRSGCKSPSVISVSDSEDGDPTPTTPLFRGSKKTVGKGRRKLDGTNCHAVAQGVDRVRRAEKRTSGSKSSLERRSSNGKSPRGPRNRTDSLDEGGRQRSEEESRTSRQAPGRSPGVERSQSDGVVCGHADRRQRSPSSDLGGTQARESHREGLPGAEDESGTGTSEAQQESGYEQQRSKVMDDMLGGCAGFSDSLSLYSSALGAEQTAAPSGKNVPFQSDWNPQDHNGGRSASPVPGSRAVAPSRFPEGPRRAEERSRSPGGSDRQATGKNEQGESCLSCPRASPDYGTATRGYESSSSHPSGHMSEQSSSGEDEVSEDLTCSWSERDSKERKGKKASTRSRVRRKRCFRFAKKKKEGDPEAGAIRGEGKRGLGSDDETSNVETREDGEAPARPGSGRHDMGCSSPRRGEEGSDCRGGLACSRGAASDAEGGADVSREEKAGCLADGRVRVLSREARRLRRAQIRDEILAREEEEERAKEAERKALKLSLRGSHKKRTAGSASRTRGQKLKRDSLKRKCPSTPSEQKQNAMNEDDEDCGGGFESDHYDDLANGTDVRPGGEFEVQASDEDEDYPNEGPNTGGADEIPNSAPSAYPHCGESSVHAPCPQADLVRLEVSVGLSAPAGCYHSPGDLPPVVLPPDTGPLLKTAVEDDAGPQGALPRAEVPVAADVGKDPSSEVVDGPEATEEGVQSSVDRAAGCGTGVPDAEEEKFLELLFGTRSTEGDGGRPGESSPGATERQGSPAEKQAQTGQHRRTGDSTPVVYPSECARDPGEHINSFEREDESKASAKGSGLEKMPVSQTHNPGEWGGCEDRSTYYQLKAATSVASEEPHVDFEPSPPTVAPPPGNACPALESRAQGPSGPAWRTPCPPGEAVTGPLLVPDSNAGQLVRQCVDSCYVLDCAPEEMFSSVDACRVRDSRAMCAPYSSGRTAAQAPVYILPLVAFPGSYHVGYDAPSVSAFPLPFGGHHFLAGCAYNGSSAVFTPRAISPNEGLPDSAFNQTAREAERSPPVPVSFPFAAPEPAAGGVTAVPRPPVHFVALQPSSSSHLPGSSAFYVEGPQGRGIAAFAGTPSAVSVPFYWLPGSCSARRIQLESTPKAAENFPGGTRAPACWADLNSTGETRSPTVTGAPDYLASLSFSSTESLSPSFSSDSASSPSTAASSPHRRHREDGGGVPKQLRSVTCSTDGAECNAIPGASSAGPAGQQLIKPRPGSIDTEELRAEEMDPRKCPCRGRTADVAHCRCVSDGNENAQPRGEASHIRGSTGPADSLSSSLRPAHRFSVVTFEEAPKRLGDNNFQRSSSIEGSSGWTGARDTTPRTANEFSEEGALFPAYEHRPQQDRETGDMGAAHTVVSYGVPALLTEQWAVHQEQQRLRQQRHAWAICGGVESVKDHGSRENSCSEAFRGDPGAQPCRSGEGRVSPGRHKRLFLQENPQQPCFQQRLLRQSGAYCQSEPVMWPSGWEGGPHTKWPVAAGRGSWDEQGGQQTCARWTEMQRGERSEAEREWA